MFPAETMEELAKAGAGEAGREEGKGVLSVEDDQQGQEEGTQVEGDVRFEVASEGKVEGTKCEKARGSWLCWRWAWATDKLPTRHVQEQRAGEVTQGRTSQNCLFDSLGQLVQNLGDAT